SRVIDWAIDVQCPINCSRPIPNRLPDYQIIQLPDSLRRYNRRMKRLISLAFVVFLIILAFGGGWLTAKLGVGSAVPAASLSDLERKFSDQMQDAALVGYFTISGREDRALRPDRYEISSVQKVGDDR